jgi:AcrR family transcriptional regulator
LVREAATPKHLAEISSADRLILAAQELWESVGHAGISARSLAEAAGLPVSSIYYHFGGMEQLFAAGQDRARMQAEAWCGRQLDAIADAHDLSPEAFPALLAALIDDWSALNRRLAFAWRECHLMASRDPAYLPALQGWQRLWPAFWREVAARCGLSAYGELSSRMFDGESLLHLTRWRRTVDRACLDELCQGWGAWLGGRLVAEGPWRRFARTQAGSSMPAPPNRGETAERIAATAADILASSGVSGLTHRATAAQTGLTLGVVSYNFRTSADLLRAAFEVTYRRTVSHVGEDGAPSVRGKDAKRAEADAILALSAPLPHLLALDELFIAVARDPELKAFAAQLRYLRGQTSRGFLQAMVGPDRSVSPLDAALMSDVGVGMQRACVGMAEDEAKPFLRQGFETLLTALGVRGASH